jgi:hypothetical protein
VGEAEQTGTERGGPESSPEPVSVSRYEYSMAWARLMLQAGSAKKGGPGDRPPGFGTYALPPLNLLTVFENLQKILKFMRDIVKFYR